MKYSVVVPVYNEEGNIAQLDKEIRQIMDKISRDYEVIYINDGSNFYQKATDKKVRSIMIV